MKYRIGDYVKVIKGYYEGMICRICEVERDGYCLACEEELGPLFREEELEPVHKPTAFDRMLEYYV